MGLVEDELAPFLDRPLVPKGDREKGDGGLGGKLRGSGEW